jgi:hypothetical protein
MAAPIDESAAVVIPQFDKKGIYVVPLRTFDKPKDMYCPPLICPIDSMILGLFITLLPSSATAAKRQIRPVVGLPGALCTSNDCLCSH